MGIFVRSDFHLTLYHAEPQTAIGKALHISDYLVYLSVIPTLLLGGFLGGSIVAKLMNKDLVSKFLAGMVITVFGYFLGAVGGQLYQNAVGDKTEGHAAIQPILLHAATASLAQDQAGDEADHDKTSGEATDIARQWIMVTKLLPPAGPPKKILTRSSTGTSELSSAFIIA